MNFDAARAFEMRTQRQNRRMLDGGDDDLVALVGGLERAEDGGVVGFRPARGEEDLLAERRAEQRAHPFARLFHRQPARSAEVVH